MLGKIIKAIRLLGGVQLAEFQGGQMLNGARLDKLTTLAYSAAPVMNAALGNHFLMTVTNNTAFVVGAPLNPPPSGYTQTLTLEIVASGSATAAGTLNAAFKGAALDVIADTKRRLYTWRWNGANWAETGRSTGDIT